MGNYSLRTGYGHFNYREQKTNRHNTNLGWIKYLSQEILKIINSHFFNILGMTYFQKITFHNFRFQRNMIPRSAGLSFTRRDLEEMICFILCPASSFPFLSPLIAFEKAVPSVTLTLQARCSCQIPCPEDGGQERSSLLRLCTDLF